MEHEVNESRNRMVSKYTGKTSYSFCGMIVAYAACNARPYVCCVSEVGELSAESNASMYAHTNVLHRYSVPMYRVSQNGASSRKCRM